jgi:hypothetical protein
MPRPGKHQAAGDQSEELHRQLGAARHIRPYSPTDYRVNKQLQMMKFDGECWELFGPIIEDTGVSG